MTLADLRVLCKRATPGPWVNAGRGDLRGPHQDGSDQTVAFCTYDPDGNFIAAARTWLPALIEVAEAAQMMIHEVEHDVVGEYSSPAIRAIRAALARLAEMK